MLEWFGEGNFAALIGLLGGIALGLAARIGRFCTLGAIEDYLYGDSATRLRMWAVAIGVAIIATHIAVGLNLFTLADAAYLDRAWNPLGSIIGGLMFGYGMALSGNCGYGALARLGGGDLRAFVIILVMGLSAYFVMSGPLATTRVWLFPVVTDATAPQGITQLLAQIGLSPLITGVLIGFVLLVAALFLAKETLPLKAAFWGSVVGLAVTSGWIGTTWIAENGFSVEPVETHSFAAPIGDTIFYFMTASGNELSFSVGSIVGVLIGAAMGSFSKGHFRWEACEDPRELKRQILGAAIMGPGAILAVGCSVGQGISAFSTLAFSAPVTLLAIFIGCSIGLKQLIVGFSPVSE